MDSLTSSVSPSLVLPPRNGLPRHHRRREVSLPASFNLNRFQPQPQPPPPQQQQQQLSGLCCSVSGGAIYSVSGRRLKWCPAGVVVAQLRQEQDDGGGEEDWTDKEEVERALHMDGTIPGTSAEFVRQVSSRAYDMRRHLQQTFDTSSYDVLEANPWRDSSKPVYVLTQKENQLCTMKTRRNRSEVERELGLLFSKGRKLGSDVENQPKKSGTGMKFQMLVEDIREGVLVFEDENEAAKYCDLLQGGGQGCEGVAEIEASSVFDLCQKMRALAVLFRRGRTPPLPESLKLNLSARKRSLEDQEDLI